jgi:hypothetical protein
MRRSCSAPSRNVSMYRASVSETFRLYRAALKHCWLPSLLLALSWGWAATLLDRRLGSSDDPFVWLAQVQVLAWSGYFWRLAVAVSAVSALLYSAMVADLYAAATGGVSSAASGLWAAVRAFPGVLVAAAIFLVVTSIGTMLFIVPGAYIWGMWQLWLVVLVVERSGPVTALRRSWQLVEGHWWRITTLITVVTVIAVIPSLLFDALTSMILLLLGRGGAHAPPLVTAAAIALDVFLLPLVPAALVVAYLDRQRAPVVHG